MLLSRDESHRTMHESIQLEVLSEAMAPKIKKLAYAENHIYCVMEIIERIETQALRYPAYANLVYGRTYEQLRQTLTSGTAVMAAQLTDELISAIDGWKNESDREHVTAFFETEQMMELSGF